MNVNFLRLISSRPLLRIFFRANNSVTLPKSLRFCGSRASVPRKKRWHLHADTYERENAQLNYGMRNLLLLPTEKSRKRSRVSRLYRLNPSHPSR